LLLIGDDMGNETLSCYEWSKNPAKTPTLDDLCQSGVRFDNFWSQPICSPTRATMLTGRYGFRTGVGRPTGDNKTMGYFPDPPPKPATAPNEPPRRTGGGPRRENAPPDWGLPITEFTLPMAFKVNQDLGYSTAAIGKWHLSDNRNGWQDHPNIVGFDHFSGLIRGFPDSFFTWNKVVNGEWSGKTGYTPDDKTTDAIDWIEEQGDQPWFLWMAYNLIHTPLHLPPDNRWRGDWSDIDPAASPLDDGLEYGNMLLEALDVEIERLLASLPKEVRDNTYIIFMGDNGSGRRSVRPPVASDKAKGTLYQGGINVPLFVTGPGIVKGTSKALVNSTDMFMTIMEMAGIDASHTIPENLVLDSVSFMPYLSNPDSESIRDFAYADVFAGNFAGIEDGDFTVRNDEFKLFRKSGDFEFYNLKNDPFEADNLLDRGLGSDERAQYDSLLQRVTELRNSASPTASVRSDNK
jgi:arylsulfatase A-like enzyme